VKIVQRMHKELDEKRERMAKMSSASKVSSNFSNNTSDQSEDDKKERRVIIMVVINSLVNFLLRSSDFFIFLEESSSSFVFSLNSFYPGLPNLFLDISYLTYILTFSFNVLLFYKFNSKFKEAFVILPKKKVCTKI
jgi:hypothetical protein